MSFRVGRILLLLLIMTFFHIMFVKNVGLGSVTQSHTFDGKIGDTSVYYFNSAEQSFLIFILVILVS